MLVSVQRLPSRYSSLTANSSRRVSITAGLAFILPTPSASSHPSFWLLPAQSEARRGLGASVPALIQLQRVRKGRVNITTSVSKMGGMREGVGHPLPSIIHSHVQKTAVKVFNITPLQRIGRSVASTGGSFGTGPLDPIGKDKRFLCVFWSEHISKNHQITPKRISRMQ